MGAIKKSPILLSQYWKNKHFVSAPIIFSLILGLITENLSTTVKPNLYGKDPLAGVCVWGTWGSWSTCSKSCGGTGTRTRSRNQVDRMIAQLNILLPLWDIYGTSMAPLWLLYDTFIAPSWCLYGTLFAPSGARNCTF